MPPVTGHSEEKYLTGACLGTSRGRAWPNLLAERWSHAPGDLGALVPRDTEVVVLLRGKLRVRRRGDGRLQQHDATEGTVWLCPAGIREDMIHLYGQIEESVHLYLPAVPLAQTALDELGLDPAGVQLDYKGGFHDPVIEAVARTVAQELARDDPVGGLLADTMAAALGVYLIHTYSNRAPGPPPSVAGALAGPRLARVLDYIDAHLDAELSLAELAREACLSPFHFARSFKAATGVAPHRFVQQRRLLRARALLAQGHLPLSAIASDCGFCSQSHFATAFKQVTGLSPGAFRAAHDGTCPTD